MGCRINPDAGSFVASLPRAQTRGRHSYYTVIPGTRRPLAPDLIRGEAGIHRLNPVVGESPPAEWMTKPVHHNVKIDS
jgi:hypothetical protein